MERTRTIQWNDPVALAAGAKGLTGLAFLQRIVGGELSQAPISETMGFTLVAAENGLTRFEGRPSESVYNPMGSVHGGWAATLLDSAMGSAVMSTLDAETAYTTAQITVNLTRGISASTGTVICEGRIVHRGKRMATAEGHLRDGAGNLLAHGTTTCMLLPR